MARLGNRVRIRGFGKDHVIDNATRRRVHKSPVYAWCPPIGISYSCLYYSGFLFVRRLTCVFDRCSKTPNVQPVPHNGIPMCTPVSANASHPLHLSFPFFLNVSYSACSLSLPARGRALACQRAKVRTLSGGTRNTKIPEKYTRTQPKSTQWGLSFFSPLGCDTTRRCWSVVFSHGGSTSSLPW